MARSERHASTNAAGHSLREALTRGRSRTSANVPARASGHHLPVKRYVHPDTFKMFEREAAAMGFTHAAVGAMVRSSYHADKQAEAAGLAPTLD